VLDTDVPAGTHKYALQFAASLSAIASIFVVDEEMAEDDASQTGGSTVAFTNMTEDGTGPTQSITLAAEGDVHILVDGVISCTPGTWTMTLKRGDTTIKTWSITAGAWTTGPWTYKDTSLAAGTYTYSITFTGSGDAFHAMGMGLVSDGTDTVSILITPYLQNLNIGLDTRARLQPWYQPNFLSGTVSYAAGGIGPHGWTVRGSYTVPQGRIAIISFVGTSALAR
jgi:hypothetical protein